jgi:hypothetical protein
MVGAAVQLHALLTSVLGGVSDYLQNPTALPPPTPGKALSRAHSGPRSPPLHSTALNSFFLSLLYRMKYYIHGTPSGHRCKRQNQTPHSAVWHVKRQYDGTSRPFSLTRRASQFSLISLTLHLPSTDQRPISRWMKEKTALVCGLLKDAVCISVYTR